ncbi:MAG: M6 family metalloprotease domain-containing protein [Candidatus Sumerlaeota bacterium]|nr:M6 family metalloprotease domain-containing protein [Candidatus Sumerlaeota bacterium]
MRRQINYCLGMAWIAATLMGFCSEASAAPVWGQIFQARQPDGTKISVRVWGDEYYRVVESLDGYTLTPDPASGWICYARLSANGEELESTGVRATAAGFQTANFQAQAVATPPQHLRIANASVRRKANAARDEILRPLAAAPRPLRAPATGLLYADQLSATAMNEPLATPPLGAVTGAIRGIVILIDFSDDVATISSNSIQDYCNKVGYNGYSNNGSVRDYFYDVSGAKLTYTNYVSVAYYRAKQTKVYYNQNNLARDLMLDALEDLDAKGFNFAAYDANSDGTVDAVNFFYAGDPDTPWATGLWPHMGWLGWARDGVTIWPYQMSSIGSSLELGTFCHENGHMICGFPDLYDYNYKSNGVGGYCLMCYSGGTNPVQPCAYLKVLAGWATTTNLAAPTANLPIVYNGNSYYKYPRTGKTNEYFLISNLRKNGRDSGLPDEGLAIWHIDTNGSNSNYQNTPSSHYLVSLEQGDGRNDLEKNTNGGDSTDLFDSGSYKTLGSVTAPSSAWWDGSDSGLLIHTVSAIGATMTFSFGDLGDFQVAPTAGANASGFMGGTFAPNKITFTLTNTSKTASLAWTASNTAAWLDLATTAGTLAANTSITLTATINTRANNLMEGVYMATLTFTDTGAKVSRQRPFRLVVKSREEVGHWKLDDASGTTARDSSGYGHNGTVAGSAVWSTAGKYNGALTFDGSDDQVDVPGLGLDASEITITCWINRNGTQPQWAGIVFERAQSVNGFNFGASNVLKYNWMNSSNAYNWNSGLTVPNAKWSFAALTVKSNAATIYLHNGTAMSSATNSISHAAGAFNSDFQLGYDNNDSARRFKGLLDDVRIFNYALSAAEINNVYLGVFARNPSPLNGASNVAPDKQLSWDAGYGASAHQVYFGMDRAAVTNATTASAEYKGQRTTKTYNPGMLGFGVSYYWRIDEITTGGVINKGEIWAFQTAAPMGYWKLDDGSGTTAADSSGNNHPGTLKNGPTWAASGKFGRALNLDGTNDYVDIPSPLNLNSNHVTIISWVKRNGTVPGSAGIFYSRSGSTVAGTFVGGTNELRYMWNNDSNAWQWSTGLTIPDQTWCFTALALDPAKATLYLYDGTRLTSASHALTHDVEAFDGSARIGSDSYAAGRVFKGAVDEVMVFNLTLSLVALQQLMQGPIPQSPTAASAPNPATGALNVPTTQTLSWTSGTAATSHDVYFGITNPPPFIRNQTGAAYAPATMLNDTLYYWRVDAKNSSGFATGAVWNFRTVIAAPVASSAPNTANNATNVAITTTLRWTAGARTTTHTLYFGTTNPPPLVGDRTAAAYTPPSRLAGNQTYYWRVNEKNIGGSTTGAVWKFTTENAPAPKPLQPAIWKTY